MDATATPRGISLAVGELGARGRPTFDMTSRTAGPSSSWTSVLVTPTPHTACLASRGAPEPPTGHVRKNPAQKEIARAGTGDLFLVTHLLRCPFIFSYLHL